MKKIWIDGYEANVRERVGSNQVAFELLVNLEKIDLENDYTILLPSKKMDDLPREREQWDYKILKPSLLWTRIALPLALYSSKFRPDVVFSPTHYIPRFSPVKRVVTIFDLAFLHFPEMFKQSDLWKLTNWTKFSCLNADHIITISNSSKKDIIDQYGISSEKITVAYPGYDEKIYKKIADKAKIDQTLDKYNIKGDYIIYVGTLQPRKNLIRLMEAFAPLENLNLVVVGKAKGEGRQGWMYQDILDAPKKLGIEERVIFTGFVNKKKLVYLYSGAIALCLPSLYEGFGLPVVEAMATGVPVIVSNVSSLPEVVGKAGLLVDPYSIDQINQAIRTVYTDKKLRDKLSKLSLKQARKFSWKKMAKEVLGVLEKT